MPPRMRLATKGRKKLLPPTNTDAEAVVQGTGEAMETENIVPLAVEYGGSIFKSSGILEPAKCFQNELPPQYEEYLKQEKLIPEDAEVWIPTNSPVRADWTAPGWFSIYEIAFRTGGSIPFSKMATELIQTVSLMPSQLLPSMWRTIHSIESINKTHGTDLRVEDIKNNYLLRDNTPGRVSLRIRPGVGRNLIAENDQGDDKNWARRYMFIKTASLGPEMSYLDYPLVESVSDWSYKEGDVASNARVEEFMKLDLVERSWPYSMRGRALGKFHLSGGVWKAPKPTSYMVPNTVDSQACASSTVAGGSSCDFNVPISSVQDVLRRVKLEAAKKATSGGKVSAKTKSLGRPVRVEVVIPEDSGETKSGKGTKRKLSLGEEDTYSEQARLTSGVKNVGVKLLDDFRKTVDGDAMMRDSLDLAFQNVGETSKLLQSALAAAHSSVLLKVKLETVERELSKVDQRYREKETVYDKLKARHDTTSLLLDSARTEGHKKDEQIASLSGQIEALKNKLISEASMWFLRGRLQAMSESEEERLQWDLESEISVFDLYFPGSAWDLSICDPSGPPPKAVSGGDDEEVEDSGDGEADSPMAPEAQAVPVEGGAEQDSKIVPTEADEGKTVQGTEVVCNPVSS